MANKVTTLIDVNTQDELYPRTKTGAVSDNDGNSLGNVAVCNYTTLSSGEFPPRVGIEMDLVWTNPSPGNAFAAQTVSLNLSKYQAILIRTLWYASSDASVRTYSNLFLPNGKFNINVGKEVNTQRPLDISSTGVVFQDCSKYMTYGNSTGTVDNNTLVPYQIYGIV